MSGRRSNLSTPSLKPLPLPGTLNFSALRASSIQPSAASSPVTSPTSPPASTKPQDAESFNDPSQPSVESPPDRTRRALEPTLHLIHQALASTELIARETFHFSDESLPRLADHLSEFADVLSQLDQLAADQDSDLNKIWIPKAVLDAVDRGENPHSATMGAMDRTAAENQYLNGKMEAAGQFARAMEEELGKEFAEEMEAVTAYLASAQADSPIAQGNATAGGGEIEMS